ncbi:MAG: WG repeat-containing protein [Lachnospiraceae bacterium]
MWGYTDRTGSIVIQPQWAVAGWYRGGTAAVCSTDGQWGIIDENGEYLVPCRYDSIWDQYSCYESTPFEDSNSYIGGLSDGFYIIIDCVDDEEYMGFFCISTKTLVEP